MVNPIIGYAKAMIDSSNVSCLIENPAIRITMIVNKNLGAMAQRPAYATVLGLAKKYFNNLPIYQSPFWQYFRFKSGLLKKQRTTTKSYKDRTNYVKKPLKNQGVFAS